jgi:hypothetical protein
LNQKNKKAKESDFNPRSGGTEERNIDQTSGAEHLADSSCTIEEFSCGETKARLRVSVWKSFLDSFAGWIISALKKLAQDRFHFKFCAIAPANLAGPQKWF